MDRRSTPVAAAALGLAIALAGTVAAALGGLAARSALADDEPPAKPVLTAEELERRLDGIKLTVDWKNSHVLDAINEVQQKSGLKFAFDQALANFADKRTVTFDGYAVTAREALRVLGKAGGFTFEPDAAAGVFQLKMDAAFPTRVALEEKKITVAWKDTPVSKAIAEIEKKTGLKIDLHETMKARLRNRKVTWDAEDVTAKEAIETLYVYPPPSVPGRIDAKKDMKVQIVYTGPAETKAEVELALDDRTLSCGFNHLALFDALKQVAELSQIKIEMESKLVKEGGGGKVTYKAERVPIRMALDVLAKQAGVTWKVEGAKIMFRSAPAPAGEKK